MAIIVSTSCQNGLLSLTENISRLISVGLIDIELSYSPPVTNDELAHLPQYGARFNVHNYFPPASPPFVLNLASKDKEILNASLTLAKRAIELSAYLGASFYTIHAGCCADIKPDSLGKRLEYQSLVDYHTAYEQMVDSLKELCDFAQKKKIAIGVENHVLSYFNLIEGQNKLLLGCESWELKSLIRDVGKPNLGILLDTGHLAVTSNTLGFDRWQFIEELAHHVIAIHTHDNDGVNDLHRPVQPGSWILDVLRYPKFSGLPIIMEAKFDNIIDLQQNVEWLKMTLECR